MRVDVRLADRGVGSTAYNQVIDGHNYWLQEEYSNVGSGCFQNSTQEHPPTGSTLAYHGGQVMRTNTTYAIYWLPTPGNATLPAVTGTAAVKQTLASSVGAWSGSPAGYAYQWQRCSSPAAGCVGIPGATSSSYTLTTADGGTYVQSTVSATNVNGSSAYVPSVGQLVVPIPALKKAPRISGRARVGRRLSASKGLWTGPPSAYRFQWLRCNAHGGGCASIHGATHSKYRLTGRDARHRLRVRVTASNVAGSRHGDVTRRRPRSRASSLAAAQPPHGSAGRLEGVQLAR